MEATWNLGSAFNTHKHKYRVSLKECRSSKKTTSWIENVGMHSNMLIVNRTQRKFVTASIMPMFVRFTKTKAFPHFLLG